MENSLGQDSNPAHGSFDKSRVLNVKPLRTLVPIFPSPSNASSSSNSQGGAPFVSVSPSGPFPPGISSFYPFFFSPESHRFPEQNLQTPAAGVPAVPLNSFRTPTPRAKATTNGIAGSSRRSKKGLTNDDGYSNSHQINFAVNETDAEDGSQDRRTRSQKKKKGRQGGGAAAVEVDVDAVANDVLKSINPAVFDVLNQPDGGRDSVSYTLMIFEVIRRKIQQIEDLKDGNPGVARRPDLRAGTIMLSKGVRTNSKKRIGAVPGVEIGDIFFFRMNCVQWGCMHHLWLELIT